MTAHYLDDNFELGSCLLECIKFGERHTADNLATELLRIAREWKVEKKVVLVVTDDTANIVSAVKTAGYKSTFPVLHILLI